MLLSKLLSKMLPRKLSERMAKRPQPSKFEVKRFDGACSPDGGCCGGMLDVLQKGIFVPAQMRQESAAGLVSADFFLAIMACKGQQTELIRMDFCPFCGKRPNAKAIVERELAAKSNVRQLRRV